MRRLRRDGVGPCRQGPVDGPGARGEVARKRRSLLDFLAFQSYHSRMPPTRVRLTDDAPTAREEPTMSMLRMAAALCLLGAGPASALPAADDADAPASRLIS